MGEKIKDIISKMEMLERVVGRLYKIYADSFQADSSFWVQLSKEEEDHAGMIKELEKEVQNSNLSFDETRFNLNAIQTTIRYVQQKIKQANDGLLTAQEAYNIAWDIENGLLEKNFFQTFQTDNHRLRVVLKKLITDTTEHRNRVNRQKNKNIFT